MSNPHLTSGSVWRLHHGDQEIARLTVTENDMPWTYAQVEELPGFEEFRPVFAEQVRALAEEDPDRLNACFVRIRDALTMTFPDGRPVTMFLLHIERDGRARWRWHDESFDAR